MKEETWNWESQSTKHPLEASTPDEFMGYSLRKKNTKHFPYQRLRFHVLKNSQGKLSQEEAIVRPDLKNFFNKTV